MTRRRARIGEGLARFRYKLPIVAARVQRQLENAEGVGIANFAVGENGGQGGVVGAAAPHNKLANASNGVSDTIWILRRKTFIDVVMSAQNKVSIRVVKCLPKWFRVS